MKITCPGCNGIYDSSMIVDENFPNLLNSPVGLFYSKQDLQRQANLVQFIKHDDNIFSCPDCFCIFKIEFIKNTIKSTKL